MTHAPAPPDLARLRDERIFVRDADGTGSLHICWQGDPGARAFAPVSLFVSLDTENIRLTRELSAAVAANQQCMERLEQARMALQLAMPVVHKAQVAATMEAIQAPPDDTTAKTRDTWRAQCLTAETAIAAFLAKPEGQP